MADSGNNNITENSPNNDNDNNVESICTNDCDIGAITIEGASTSCGASTSKGVSTNCGASTSKGVSTSCGASTSKGVSTSCGASTSVDVGGVSENAVEEVANYDSSSDDDRCGICLEEKRSPVRVRCGHTFCGICLARHQSFDKYPWSKRCPNCRGTLEENPVTYDDEIGAVLRELPLVPTDDQDSDDENDLAMQNEIFDDDEADDIILEGLDWMEADEDTTGVLEDEATDSLTLVMFIILEFDDAYVLIPLARASSSEEIYNLLNEAVPDNITEDSDALSIQSDFPSFEVNENAEENEEDSNTPDDITEGANGSDTEDSSDAFSIESHFTSFEENENDEENQEDSNISDEYDIEIGAFESFNRKMCMNNTQANSDEATTSSIQSFRDENTPNEGENRTEQNDELNDSALLHLRNQIIPPAEKENYVVDILSNDTVNVLGTLIDETIEQLRGMRNNLSSTQSPCDENTGNEGENHTEQNDETNNSTLLPVHSQFIPPEEEGNYVVDVVANDTVDAFITLLDEVMEQLNGLGDILS